MLLVRWLSGLIPAFLLAAVLGGCDSGQAERALQENLTAARAQIEDLSTESKSMRASMDAMKKENEALRARNRELAAEGEKLAKQVRDLGAKGEQLRKEQDRLRLGASRELKVMTDSRDSALREYQAATKQIHTLSKNLERAQQAHEQAQSALKQCRAETANKEAGLRAQLAVSKKALDSMHKQLQSLTVSRDKASAELGQSRKLVANLTGRLNQAETDLESIQEEAATLRAHWSSGQHQIDELASENAEASRALEQVRTDAQRMASQLRAEHDPVRAGMVEPSLDAGYPLANGLPPTGPAALGVPDEAAITLLQQQEADLARAMRQIQHLRHYTFLLRNRLMASQSALAALRRQSAMGLNQCGYMAQRLAGLVQENQMLRAYLAAPSYP